MEGFAGLNSWKQDQKIVSEIMEDNLKAVIEALQENDKNQSIDEIVIADSHSSGNNIGYSITEMDKRISLISGYPRTEYMMPGLDESFSAVFLLGYHAGIGEPLSTMDHTYSASCVHNIWINGRIMNESIINALYAGCYDVPVALIIGDDALQKQLKRERLLDGCEFVVTKESLSRFSAKNHSWVIVKERIQKAVKKVFENKFKYKPLRFDAPYELKMGLANTAMADLASLIPGVKRIDGRTVVREFDDYKELFNCIMAIVHIASKAL